MDERQFQSLLRSEVQQAVNYHESEFDTDRATVYEYYFGEPFGNEVEGRSSVVATEVSDTIEFIMPQLIKIFASGDYVRFMPRMPEDREQAEAATDLVNFIMEVDNPGFRILYSWFKDALLFKLGVVKTYWEAEPEVLYESYNGLTEDDLAGLIGDDAVEVIGQEAFDDIDPETGMAQTLYNIDIRKTVESGRVRVENVPPEEFLYSRQTVELESAPFCAHRTEMRVSELVERGYDYETIMRHAGSGSDGTDDAEKQQRFETIEHDSETETNDPSMKRVLVTEAYIRADYDGDKIAELRRVIALGQECEIVENEVFDYIPFAVLSPILMPHRMVGRSVAELLMDLQLIKSTVFRQMLDNFYQTNNAQTEAVEGQVNMGDLLSPRPGGVVRVRQPGMVRPMIPPQLGQDALATMAYLDEVRDTRVGFSKAAAGLDPDLLQNQTATAVNVSTQAAQAKIELIARVFAETGARQLARNILHLITQHMDQARIVRIRNEFVEIDPTEWRNGFDLEVQVGLGNGREDERMAMLMQIAGKQEQIMQTLGPLNPIVKPSQYVATLGRIAELAGFKDTSQFFNGGPEVDQAAEQLAGQEAEAGQGDGDAQAKAMQAQAELELKAQEMQAKMQLEQMKLEQEIALKREQMEAEMALRQQEAEREFQLRQLEIQVGAPVSTNLPRA